MALDRNDDLSRNTGLNDSTDDLRRRARLDTELQADPELAEGTASGGRIGLFAIAVVAILGVVFYGLNNSSVNTSAPTSTASQTAPQNTTTGTPNATNSVPPAGQNSAQQQVTPPAGQTTGSATTPSAAPSANSPTLSDPAPSASTPQAAPTGQDAPRANDSAPAREPSN